MNEPLVTPEPVVLSSELIIYIASYIQRKNFQTIETNEYRREWCIISYNRKRLFNYRE